MSAPKFLKHNGVSFVFDTDALNAAGFKHQTDLPEDQALELANAVFKLLEENQTNGSRSQLICCDIHDFVAKTKAAAESE